MTTTADDAERLSTDPSNMAADGLQLEPEHEPGIFSFGIAEMMYLCQCMPTEAAKRSLATLRLEDRFDDDIVRISGASSLFARGFLAPVEGDPERMVPQAAAAAIAYALSHANRWIGIAFLGVDASDTAALMRGGGVSLFLQQRALGAFHIAIVDQEVSDEETIWNLIDNQLEVAPASTIFLSVEQEDDDEDLPRRRASM